MTIQTDTPLVIVAPKDTEAQFPLTGSECPWFEDSQLRCSLSQVLRESDGPDPRRLSYLRWAWCR